MVVAIGTAGAVIWWVALGLFVLVVIPLVLLLASALVQVVAEIRRYADDIREHGTGLADELEAVGALLTTRDLLGTLKTGLAQYADAVGRILARGGPA